MARRGGVTPLRPGPSMLGLLPRQWAVAPSDHGAWFLLGGPLAGDPDVMISVEQAVGGDRDLGEPMAWLLAEVLAMMTGGHTEGVELSERERSDLTCQLRMMLRMARGLDG